MNANAERAERAASAEVFQREGLLFAWPQALLFVTLIALLSTMVRAPMGGVTVQEMVLWVVLLAVSIAGLRFGWGTRRFGID